MYFRYVDDTFCAFGSETEADEFFSHLNNMHPALRFTLEKENNSTLPFLDALVCKETPAFLTTVYRKPTFTGVSYISQLTLAWLVIELLTRSLLMYVSAIFLPTWVWFSVCGCFDIWSKRRPSSPANIVVLWFILLNMFAVSNTSGEPNNVWHRELNSMYP